MLRYKTLVGDEEPEVLTDAIRALLELDPDRSLHFVARCLNDERPEVAEAAGLALGGSRLDAAFEVLRAWWTSTSDPNLKACAALALAMLRKEAAVEFLLDLVAGESMIDARHALAGLAIYRHDEAVRQRVEDAVAVVDDPVLRRELDRLFDSV